MVICGKYKILNKTKINISPSKLTVNNAKKRAMLIKKCFDTERSKRNFVRRNLKK